MVINGQKIRINKKDVPRELLDLAAPGQAFTATYGHMRTKAGCCHHWLCMQRHGIQKDIWKFLSKADLPSIAKASKKWQLMPLKERRQLFKDNFHNFPLFQKIKQERRR